MGQVKLTSRTLSVGGEDYRNPGINPSRFNIHIVIVIHRIQPLKGHDRIRENTQLIVDCQRFLATARGEKDNCQTAKE
jgi:hypothetical protein